MRYAMRLIAVGFFLAVLAGCSLYRNDRCYVAPEKYALARDLFIESGALNLVEQSLRDLQWRRCEINEALYRLQKEFEVLPETPAPSEA